MARKKTKAITKKTSRKVGRPRKAEVALSEKPRAKRRAATQTAKKARKKVISASKQIETLCEIVAAIGQTVRELHVEVRPMLKMVNDLKRYVDDLRYRMSLAEQSINKGAGTSMAEFTTADIARVLANKLEEDSTEVAQ